MDLKKIIIALVASTMLWSCSDDDKSENNEASSISLSTETIQMDIKGGEATVTVTSSGDWRLTGLCDWAEPSKRSGKSGDVITFIIQPNDLNEVRTANFKFFTGSSVVSLQVESNPFFIMELQSENNVQILKNKSILKIQLKTNILNPTISFSDNSEQWIKFDRRSEFKGIVTLSFAMAENTTYKDRQGTINISSPLINEAIDVSITQNKTNAIIINEKELVYDLASRKISIDLKYNTEYSLSITKGNDWITNQIISEPVIGEDGLSSVTLSYQLNEASISRGGKIHLTDTNNELAIDVLIAQIDPDATLVEFPDNVFQAFCVSNSWIFPAGNNKYVVLEDGMNATSLTNNSYNIQWSDLTGIESFPNLTTISLGYCEKMKKLDISGLHKVSKLSFTNAKMCEVYDLGDNPILNFNKGGSYAIVDIESLKIVGSKIESIDLSLSPWYSADDKATSIDVSECPSLVTLNANRTNRIKTLYLKTGQVIPNLKKNDATEIVYK